MPPESGTSPILAKAWTKLAERAASTMSQASAILAPAPAATPLTAATTGKGKAAQLAHERIVIGLERAPEHHRLSVRGHAFAQVLPGAEGTAGAGQQQGAAIGIVLGLGERALERLMHRLVKALSCLRPVQRDDAIARAPLDQDRCFFHGASSCRMA